eukprot:53594-Chlamydomonas_euryale.AAC.1
MSPPQNPRLQVLLPTHTGALPANTAALPAPATPLHPITPPHLLSRHVHTHLLEQLFQQQRLQAGVELLADILQQHRDAKLDGVLERAHVVAVGELDDAQVGRRLHLLHPLVGLRLRVDHERPAPRVGHHDGVVDGEGVVGKPEDAPLPDPDGVAQSTVETELAGARDAVALECRDPLAHDLAHAKCGGRS